MSLPSSVDRRPRRFSQSWKTVRGALLGLLVVATPAVGAVLWHAETLQQAHVSSLMVEPSLANHDKSLPVVDEDGDGLPDILENVASGTDLSLTDSDADGMPDLFEYRNNLNPNDPRDAAEDWDGDAATNLVEYKYAALALGLLVEQSQLDEWILYGPNPAISDTDGRCTLDGDPFDRTRFAASQDPPVLQCGEASHEGMPDGWEIRFGLDPLDPSDAKGDLDEDGIANLQEFQNGTNPREADTDRDGLTDLEELSRFGTNPTSPDSDRDGIPDEFEIRHGLEPENGADAQGDKDADGLINLEEFERGGDPTRSDTDGDGMWDGWEAAHNLVLTDPSDGPLDWDHDELANAQEFQVREGAWGASTDPAKPDMDLDGLSDGEEALGLNEYRAPSNPFSSDTDKDGLPDVAEVRSHGTNPAQADTDGDTLNDRLEVVTSLTDPKRADTDADEILDGPEWSRWGKAQSASASKYRSLSAVPQWLRSSYPGFSLAQILLQFGPLGDLDADAATNIRDADADGDELRDGTEVVEHKTDPGNWDSDADLMPDGWELRYNLNPLSKKDQTEDSDRDGVVIFTNLQTNGTAIVSPPSRPPPVEFAGQWKQTFLFTNLFEYRNQTNPRNPDSDCDGVPDGWEVQFGLLAPIPANAHPNPRIYDSEKDLDEDGLDLDHDGLVSGEEEFTVFEEWWFSTAPDRNDTNNNTRLDGFDAWVQRRASPSDSDPANVGLRANGEDERSVLTQDCARLGLLTVSARVQPSPGWSLVLLCLAGALIVVGVRWRHWG